MAVIVLAVLPSSSSGIHLLCGSENDNSRRARGVSDVPPEQQTKGPTDHPDGQELPQVEGTQVSGWQLQLVGHCKQATFSQTICASAERARKQSIKARIMPYTEKHNRTS